MTFLTVQKQAVSFLILCSTAEFVATGEAGLQLHPSPHAGHDWDGKQPAVPTWAAQGVPPVAGETPCVLRSRVLEVEVHKCAEVSFIVQCHWVSFTLCLSRFCLLIHFGFCPCGICTKVRTFRSEFAFRGSDSEVYRCSIIRPDKNSL